MEAVDSERVARIHSVLVAIHESGSGLRVIDVADLVGIAPADAWSIVTAFVASGTLRFRSDGTIERVEVSE